MVACSDDFPRPPMSQPKFGPAERKELVGIVGRLYDAIKAQGLSQFELARRIGMSQSGINEVFKILRNPKAPMRIPGILYLSRVPDALQINGHWFLTGQGKMEDYHQEEGRDAAAIRYALMALSRIEDRMAEVRKDLSTEHAALSESLEARAARAALREPLPAVVPPARRAGGKRGR